MMNNPESLKNTDKYSILDNSKALSALQEILDRKNTAEIFVGKYGLVVREISRKTKYTHQEWEFDVRD